MGSWSQPKTYRYLFGDNSALNSFNQTKPERVEKKRKERGKGRGLGRGGWSGAEFHERNKGSALTQGVTVTDVPN